MFLNVSYSHQCCIYLTKNTVGSFCHCFKSTKFQKLNFKFQIFDFANIFSEERQTFIVMKAKILNVMDEYLLINPLLGLETRNDPVKYNIVKYYYNLK